MAHEMAVYLWPRCAEVPVEDASATDSPAFTQKEKKVKTKLNAWVGGAMASAILLAACGTPAATPAPAAPAAPAATEAPAAPAAPAAAKKRIKLVLNGTLGDKSFFDSAKRGVDKMASDLGYETKVVEMGYDRNKWEPGLEEAAATDDYDVLIAGTFDMSGYVQAVAPKYPTKQFWTFDAGPDFAACEGGCKNVYSIYFKQNEGSYLLGVAMGNLIKAKSLPNQGDRTKVGIIGGLDIPVINDFIVGFKQGFKEAGMNPDTDVIVQYVGGDTPFSNPAKGKEIAKSMFAQGAVMVWGVAGSSGNGAFEAAAEDGLYALGVDSDQFLTIPDEKQKATIVTSMLKNVDAGLFRAAKLDAEGKLTYGAAENVGAADDAVGVAVNDNYNKFVSAEIQAIVAAAFEKVKSGATKVDTAFK
jgi:basic membrane protein A and related proteins